MSREYEQRLAVAGMDPLIGDVGIGVYVECSTPGCADEATYLPRTRRRVSVEEAEAAITRKGWLRREGRFVCPRCAEAKQGGPIAASRNIIAR